jgi:hypothetical protein
MRRDLWSKSSGLLFAKGQTIEGAREHMPDDPIMHGYTAPHPRLEGENVFIPRAFATVIAVEDEHQ